MMKSVYLLCTLDTKAAEAGLIRDRLQQLGVRVTVVDTGCLGAPPYPADVSREAIYEAAGSKLSDHQQRGDRGAAVTAAAQGAAEVVARAEQENKLAGILALGGSAGTSIGTAAMRRVAVGVPKVMVSTMASGDVRGYVGDKDVLMLNSVVDLAGINRISRPILENAAAAMAGMVLHPASPTHDATPLIAATMFGVTTPCVQRARRLLESAGYEVVVFHATGNGGQAMESLIREGAFAGVLDITTTELADELVGGVLSAGPTRLTAAAACGVPQVVSVGATDMVNFSAETPAEFADRKFYVHNPSVTLMRTTAEECGAIGREMARKLAADTARAVVLFPRRGVSAIDADGQPFADSDAREELLAGLRELPAHVPLIELDAHINDAEFAEEAAKTLLQLLRDAKGKPADAPLRAE